MTTPSPPVIAFKRALSTSPPPPVPAALSATSTDLQATKRVKTEHEGANEVSEGTSTAPAISIDSATPQVTASVETTILPPSAPKPVSSHQQNKNTARNPNKKGKKGKEVKAGGAEETGHFDVIELLGLDRVTEMKLLEEGGKNWRKESEVEWGVGADGRYMEVRIVGMSAHGDGLGLLTPASATSPTRLIAVPFTLPSELVLVHIHRHEPDYYMSHGDLIKIIEPSVERSFKEGEVQVEVNTTVGEELLATRAKFGERVQCKYFGVCSGCQYQPLSYEQQLIIKQTVVRKAFANFSTLPPSQIPAIGTTIASPLQYAYRTKLTPHFQSPPNDGKSSHWKSGKKFKGKGKGRNDENADGEEEKDWELTIGFEMKGRKRIVDIEECVIATKVINDKLVTERQRVKDTISTFKRGATLLLRDSLPPRPSTLTSPASEPSTEAHICVTDHHETVREQVGAIEFEQIAGSFFQNNSSILPSLMSWIEEALEGSREASTTLNITEGEVVDGEKSKKYLIDAYCGSGLFAISLAGKFDQVEGVEIDKASVKWAKLNAEFNKGEGRGEVGFRAGNAEAIFDVRIDILKGVQCIAPALIFALAYQTIKFPSAQTTILIDPPRKGCDPLFLSQLLSFNPSTIIYVSCNVHTQARDIGWIVKESEKKALEEGKGKKGFWIESLRAADLFANTHHAEGVAVLRREI